MRTWVLSLFRYALGLLSTAWDDNEFIAILFHLTMLHNSFMISLNWSRYVLALAKIRISLLDTARFDMPSFLSDAAMIYFIRLCNSALPIRDYNIDNDFDSELSATFPKVSVNLFRRIYAIISFHEMGRSSANANLRIRSRRPDAFFTARIRRSAARIRAQASRLPGLVIGDIVLY